MKRDEQIYILDIIDAMEKLIDFSKEFTFNEFIDNWKFQDIVVRRFEIIGEASSRISNENKGKFKNISWRLMKDMRNKLIHNYDGISYETIYDTIINTIPVELEKLKQIDLNKL